MLGPNNDGLIAEGSVTLPAGTALTRFGRVLKSADRAVRLSARASANRKSAGVDDLELRLTAGQGRVVFDRGRVRFVSADPDTKTTVQADISGDFEAAGIEHLLGGLLPGGKF